MNDCPRRLAATRRTARPALVQSWPLNATRIRKRAGLISRTQSGVSARLAHRARCIGPLKRPALADPLRRPIRPAKSSTAVARGGSKSLAIADPNFAASITDHSFHLQALRNQGDRGSANSQRLRYGFLG